jgi:hypothetical protein
VVLAKLCPGAVDALSDAAEGFTARAALAGAGAELERALSDRFASRWNLEIGLGSPWSDELLGDLDATDHDSHAQRARVAELLVECLLHRPPGGKLAPDRRDVHHLLDLAAAALHASLEAQYAYAGLRPARLEVSELGDVEILAAAPPKVDSHAWRDAQIEAEAQAFAARNHEHPGSDVTAQEDSHHLEDDEDEHETLRSVLEAQASRGATREALEAQAMLGVDDQMRENCGFGLDGFAAVLSVVASWEVPEEPFLPIAQVSCTDLVERVVTWSGLPRHEIEAAVNACTVTAALIQEEGFNYWQLERRSARLALRPLERVP